MDGNVEQIVDIIMNRVEGIATKVDEVHRDMRQLIREHNGRMDKIEQKLAAMTAVERALKERKRNAFAVNTLIITIVTTILVVALEHLLDKF